MDEIVKTLTEELDNYPDRFTHVIKRKYLEELLSLLSEKDKEIEELKHQVRIKDILVINLKTRIKDLQQGIGEVLDGTLPFLAGERLKKLIEKGEEGNE